MDVEGNSHDLILGIILAFAKVLRKTTKNLSWDSRSLDQDLNPGLPECKAGMLTTMFSNKLVHSALCGMYLSACCRDSIIKINMLFIINFITMNNYCFLSFLACTV
jgi:hypothetical protein